MSKDPFPIFTLKTTDCYVWDLIIIQGLVIMSGPDYMPHALRKPDPGEPSSLENLEQTEILPEKVYQTEKFPEQTEILTEQTEILVDQDT